MRKLFTLLFSIVSGLSLIYYASEFYDFGEKLNKGTLIIFLCVITSSLGSIVMGIWNNCRIKNLEIQNIELAKMMKELSDKVDSYHISEMKSIHSNAEMILDIDFEKGED